MSIEASSVFQILGVELQWGKFGIWLEGYLEGLELQAITTLTNTGFNGGAVTAATGGIQLTLLGAPLVEASNASCPEEFQNYQGHKEGIELISSLMVIFFKVSGYALYNHLAYFLSYWQLTELVNHYAN